MKECPYCAEKIQEKAVKCKHCGSSLNGAPLKVRDSMKGTALTLKIIGIILMFISIPGCMMKPEFAMTGIVLFIIGFFVAVAGRALD